MSRGFRERVAVSLLGAAIVLGAVLGVVTVRSFNQPASAVAVQQGEVSGTQANTTATTSSPWYLHSYRPSNVSDGNIYCAVGPNGTASDPTTQA